LKEKILKNHYFLYKFMPELNANSMTPCYVIHLCNVIPHYIMVVHVHVHVTVHRLFFFILSSLRQLLESSLPSPDNFCHGQTSKIA